MQYCRNVRTLVAPLALLLAAGAAWSDVAVPGASIEGVYPGVIRAESFGRTLAFAGVPMSSGATALGAAESWIASHAHEFGAGEYDLRLLRSGDLNSGRFTSFMYQQYKDGVPVEHGAVHLTVLNRFEQGVTTHRVVMASAKLADFSRHGLSKQRVSGDAALEVVRGTPRYASLRDWSLPTLCVHFGEGDDTGWTPPVLTWKFTGERRATTGPIRYTFFVDANSGRLVSARNEVHSIDITGTVQGLATPGSTADHPGNPPVLTGIPMMEVYVQGTGNPGSRVITDANGAFTIPWAGSSPVTLEVRVRDNGASGNGGGPWVSVEHDNETLNNEIVVTQSVTPGTPATININPTSSEYTNAQVNAFIHQTRTHNYIKQWAPGFTGVDTQLPAIVMINASCNAFYNGVSTNFYNAAGTCNNTAFSSVVAHEYGHHIVNRLFLAQGGFGEGYSDTISMLQYDDPVVGRFFRTDGSPVRTPDTTNRQYPTNNPAVHAAGEVLGGVVWEVRKNMGTRYGQALGLDLTRQLHADWSLITMGGLLAQAAHPITALEWLTVDDNDGNFYNGTPNLPEIAAAFAAHSICLPDLRASASLQLPADPSALLTPGVPTTVRVLVGAGVNTATNSPTTVSAVRLAHRLNASGAFTPTPMTHQGGGVYQATLPGFSCAADVQWRIEVDTSIGTRSLPDGCNNTGIFEPRVANSVNILHVDNFNTSDPAWTVGPDTATTGNWVHGDPNATAAQPGAGTVGTNCWFTGQGPAGGAVGDADVDNGATILTSPTFNVAGLQGVEVLYDRWFSNNAGANPNTDVFTIQVSNNNGASFVTGEVLGPAGLESTFGWYPGGFRLSRAGLAPTSQLRVRFVADDATANGGSIYEAAIDAFRITNLICSGAACDSIDFNHDGLFPDTADIDDFLSVFGGGPCSNDPNCGDIDFNNDGLFPDTGDLDSLLSVFGGGPCL